MKETLTRHNYRDFNQRYTGTYGWLLNTDGTKRLVYISNVTDRQATFKTNDGFDYHVTIDSDMWFEFIPVNRAWFNSTDGESYLLQRVPNRQWRRGISDANTSIVKLNTLRSIQPSWELINGIFGPGDRYPNKFPKFGALSKHFALHKNGSLFFYLNNIGQVKDGVIKLMNSYVYQELQDLIKRKNFDVTVS